MIRGSRPSHFPVVEWLMRGTKYIFNITNFANRNQKEFLGSTDEKIVRSDQPASQSRVPLHD